jgi:hypothetical protein
MFDRFKQSQGKVGGASSTDGGTRPGKATLTQRIPAGAQGSGERQGLPGSLNSAAASEEEEIQREESGASDGAASPPPGGSGDPLPPDVGAQMESAFNADELGARAARGETVGRSGTIASSARGDLAQMKSNPAAGEVSDVVEASGEETMSLAACAATPEGAAQPKLRGAPIQARMAGGPIQRQEKSKPKPTYVPYQIHVKRPMTQQEFRTATLRQIFGGVPTNIEWKNSLDSYVPEQSPYTVLVDTALLKQHRGQASKERGISVGQDGGVTGAEERAKTFHASPDSDQKTALLKEIDRRYYEAVGDKTQTKINPGEAGKAELWRTLRDEVLFQHEYIANLPPQVKELIKLSTKGKELTPADYDKLFAIARKIEKMPPGQVADYASKVTGTTTNLDLFEASLDKYLAEIAEHQKQSDERDQIQTKLIGLEEVYKKYKLHKSLLTSGSMTAIGGRYGFGGGGGIVVSREAGKLRSELETELQAHGFAGISEFEAFIEKFEQAFEQEAANIAKDMLGKYAGKLYKESERYKDPAEVAALHQKLGGVRTQFGEFEANAKLWNDYVKDVNEDRGRLPGQGHLRPKTSFAEADEARKKAEAAKASAVSHVQGMSGDHPIFQEDGLPLDKRIDKASLARASEAELGGLLQAHIQNRMKDIGEARTEIEGKTALIYKMDKLMPQFYAQQGIRPGSIHDLIIQDKMRDDAISKLALGIALAMVAVALAVVTAGAATPGIIAAGAGVAGAGLGTYMALEEYQQYTQEKHLADVGFADDPSMVWVILAVVGAGLDMGAAVKAAKALGPAAKALNAGGDLAEFTKMVRALEKANEIEVKVARAAEKAAAARKGFTEATGDLANAMAGKAYSFPGPLADPDVYKAVVKMARQAIKARVYDAQMFIDELKLARVKAGLKNLSPEELAKAKQAWEEAKVLEAAEETRYQKLLQQIPDATKLDALIAKAGDAAKLERLLKVFPEAELEAIFVKLQDTGRLVVMVDQVGGDNAAKIIRQWMAKGKIDKMNAFMENLTGGVGKELAETTAVGAKAVIIDSQTAIALSKKAAGTGLQDGEKLMVKYVESLPPGTELRAGNVTIGEVGSGAVKVKGLPIEVARDSPQYKTLLAELERMNVGGGKGAADRALVADAFFAKTEPGVVPRFATADSDVFNKLATSAGIDLRKLGGKTLSQLHPGGFEVTVAAQKLHVVPIQ